MSGNQYTVTVQTKINGVWGPVGKSCDISIAGAGRTFESSVANNAYPNPFTQSFTLALNGAASVAVYDMAGRLIDAKKADTAAYLTLGEGYTAGVYHVVIAQGEEVTTFRMIKN